MAAGNGTATASSSGGIGFAGLLTILFIALKLTGVIDWEWVWVLAPLWISFAFVIVALLLFGVGTLIYLWADHHRIQTRRKLNGRR